MSSGWSGEKEDWARDLHEDVLPAYERLASSGILRLTCFGRPNIDILFPRYRFPHLVGLSYYSCRDKKRRVKIPDREFYKLIGDGDVDRFLTAQARFFRAGLAVFLIWCLLVAYVLFECFQWCTAAAGGVVAGRP